MCVERKNSFIFPYFDHITNLLIGLDLNQLWVRPESKHRDCVIMHWQVPHVGGALDNCPIFL
jgi:hypothetical protein